MGPRLGALPSVSGILSSNGEANTDKIKDEEMRISYGSTIDEGSRTYSVFIQIRLTLFKRKFHFYVQKRESMQVRDPHQ